MSDIFSQLEESFQQIIDESEAPFTEWDTIDLISEVTQLTTELQKRNEVLNPRTFEARELHNRRNAMQLILRSRGVQR